MITVGDILNLAILSAQNKQLAASIDDLVESLPQLVAKASLIDQYVQKQLAELKAMPQLYQKLELDLSIARDKEKHEVSGDFLQVKEIQGNLEVRFNDPDKDAIELANIRRIKTPFDTLYFSNEAQADCKAIIYYGKGDAFEIAEMAPIEINIVAQTAVVEMAITGSRIQVPIDIQGAYTMVPVDIQAQYVTMQIDIVAQSIGNLAIDIKAQSIENINIAITAQNIGVYLQGDWAAKTQTDLNKPGYISGTQLNVGGYVVTETVPSGKIWFITQWSACAYIDGQTESIGMRAVLEVPGGVVVSIMGGVNGGTCIFNKPMRATAGQTVRIYVKGFSASTGVLYGVFNGYEISA